MNSPRYVSSTVAGATETLSVSDSAVSASVASLTDATAALAVTLEANDPRALLAEIRDALNELNFRDHLRG